MRKVEGIKKVSKTKHIDVDDQTKEISISITKKASKTRNVDVTDQTKETQVDEIKNDEDYHVYQLGQAYRSDDAPTTQKQMSKFDSKNVNIVFMGTGKFAGNILKQIAEHMTLSKLTIITQPDKKVGRKKSSIHRSLAPNLVREFAKEHEIDLYQPIKLDQEAVARISALNPDLLIVASYGKILPKEILDIPKYSAINVHASLLPKLRGASPTQNALLLGLKETGVTIMKMDTGLDTGEIIMQESLEIKEHEKADELLERLSEIGADLLIKISKQKEEMDGKLPSTPQDSSQSTMCQLIDREDGHIQWTQTTQEIYNRYRALYPWPGIFSYWEEHENQLMRIKLRAIHPSKKELTQEQQKFMPGTVFIGGDQLCIKTFDGAIIVESVQPECKTVMPVYDFLNGHNTFEGAVLK